MTALTVLAVWAETLYIAARSRARREADVGSVAAEVAMIVGLALIAAAAIAAVGLFVTGKLGSLGE